MISVFVLIFLASAGFVGIAIAGDAMKSDIQIIAVTLVSQVGVMALGFAAILYQLKEGQNKED